MTELDTFQVLREWQDRVIVGTPAQMQRFVQELTQALPPNWSRDTAHEQFYSAQGVEHPGSLCFKRQARPDVVAVLWLLRISEGELRGGVVESTDRKRYHLDAAETIREFETVVLPPAVKASGVQLARKRPGPRSVMPDPVLKVLDEFLKTGEQTWPLSDDAARKWRRFMIEAYQSETMIDPDEFRNWLMSAGWSAPQAEALLERFQADARLMAEFKDELQTA